MGPGLRRDDTVEVFGFDFRQRPVNASEAIQNHACGSGLDRSLHIEHAKQAPLHLIQQQGEYHRAREEAHHDPG